MLTLFCATCTSDARTDHISLTLLRNFWEPEGPIARCWENLAEFDFEVVREEAAEPRMHCPDAIAGSVGPVMTPQTSTLRLWRLTQLAPLNGCSRWRERKPVGNNDTKRLGGTGKPTNLFTNPLWSITKRMQNGILLIVINDICRLGFGTEKGKHLFQITKNVSLKKRRKRVHSN
ncbi:hypothetical protein T4E_7664 [Trichinella pseudospiralis]|uniref:Uncharacterized protein n=1 Tax=Trichinella pseudospiralis TaxID=6337 RepID=A0A0V0YHL3_TRIPS|nr:hypothetical protein T4E_7664 [Trichinella pseudospiralis]